MRFALLLLLALLACQSEKKAAATRPEVQGSLAIAGKPADVTRCRAGRGVTTYVELVTARGKLRFENQKLYWSQTDFGRGDELTCDKLDRSWGGGMRKDGTAYFRGHLIFVCKGPPGTVTGDVTVDCGGITPAERAQLDQNRTNILLERCAEIDRRAAELGATSRCRELRYSAEVQGCLLAANDVAAWQTCLEHRAAP